MRRSKTASAQDPRSARERVRALPWALLLQAAVVVGNRWRALGEKDRARLARIVRESRGNPGSLGTRERLELRRIAGKLDASRMIRELLALASRSRHGRRRGRA